MVDVTKEEAAAIASGNREAQREANYLKREERQQTARKIDETIVKIIKANAGASRPATQRGTPKSSAPKSSLRPKKNPYR